MHSNSFEFVLCFSLKHLYNMKIVIFHRDLNNETTFFDLFILQLYDSIQFVNENCSRKSWKCEKVSNGEHHVEKAQNVPFSPHVEAREWEGGESFDS